MPAYRATLRLGTDWVDMDVVLTKDGQILTPTTQCSTRYRARR